MGSWFSTMEPKREAYLHMLVIPALGAELTGQPALLVSKKGWVESNREKPCNVLLWLPQACTLRHTHIQLGVWGGGDEYISGPNESKIPRDD